MVRETNPPLFYSILHGWMALVGPMSGATMLRFPSIVASALAAPALFFGIKPIYGKKAALAAALMVAVSAQQIDYAVQVRTYSFLFLALSVSFAGLLRIITANAPVEREPTFAWIAYGAGAATAIYLHTTALFWPAIATLSLMLVDKRFRPASGRRFAILIATDTAIFVCAAWWIYITYLQTKTPNSLLAWMHRPGILEYLKLLFSSTLLGRRSTGTAFIVLLLAMIGIIRTRSNVATKFIMTCLAVSVITYLAVSFKQNIIIDRTLLWMSLFPITLSAAAIGSIKKNQAYVVSTVGITFLLLVNLARHSDYLWEDWRSAITTMAHDPNGVLIVTSGPEAVAAKEACSLELRRSSCPFPIIGISSATPQSANWGTGYNPPIPSTPNGKLAISTRANVYLIQRGSTQPLPILQDANLLTDVDDHDSLLLGPFHPPTIDEIVGKTRIIDGTAIIPPNSGSPGS